MRPTAACGRWALQARQAWKLPDTKLFLSDVTQKWQASGKGTGGGEGILQLPGIARHHSHQEPWNLQLRSHHAWDTRLSSLYKSSSPRTRISDCLQSPKPPGTVRVLNEQPLEEAHKREARRPCDGVPGKGPAHGWEKQALLSSTKNRVFMYWLHCAAHAGPQLLTRVEPHTPCSGAHSPSHWATRISPGVTSWKARF